jgi:dynein heavy chain, axonemal
VDLVLFSWQVYQPFDFSGVFPHFAHLPAENSETSVNTMKEELIALQPGLLKAKADTAVLTKQVEEAIPGVDAQKAVAMKDEEATAKQAAEVKKVKDECEADLAEAIPILNEALGALNTIQKKDIDLVKAMGKPPEGVQLAMKGMQMY